MNFVIPMAGRGQRFLDKGYTIPKMLIRARGKTLMEWSIDSLPLDLCTNLVCILLEEHEKTFNLSTLIRSIYGHRFNIQFLILNHITSGQAETVFFANHLFDKARGLLIFNIDTYFTSHTLSDSLKNNNIDGILGSFTSQQDSFSFAQLDEKGFVIKTAEKEVISQFALTGLYFFQRVGDFLDAFKYYFDNNLRVNNEFYVAPIYNFLIGKGRKIILDHSDSHVILGTPEELDLFLQNPAYDTI